MKVLDGEASQPNFGTAEPNFGTAENVMAALRTAKEQGRPYVIKWRQSDAKASHLPEDAGCGCGPVE
jgi:hypothetical protein